MDAEAVAGAAPPEDRIRVPEQLVEPHPLVERTLRSLEAARPGENGLVRPRASRCLAVAVAPASVDRAARILDALIKGLEARGYKVSVAAEASGPTEVALLGEKAGILPPRSACSSATGSGSLPFRSRPTSRSAITAETGT
jgi:hypothetical protein